MSLRITIKITKDTATPLLERIKQALGLAAQTRLRLGAKAGYAKYVEFGTRRMHAEPFIRPALDAYFSDLVEAIAEGVLTGDVMSLCPVETGFLRSTIYHEVG